MVRVMDVSDRFGITVPFDGAPLAHQADWFKELADLGYTDLWSSEADGTDAFTPLAVASVAAPTLRLGTAIVPAYTRSPAIMAQSVAALAEAAPGRFVFGIGTSSNVIVERWNGIPFEEPYTRTQEMVRFVRAALEGGKVEGEWKTFSSKGFKLGRRPKIAPQIMVAGLRAGMLRMAGRESDGAIINWLGAADVPQVVAEVRAGAAAAGKDVAVSPPEIVARIFVCPTEDIDTVRAVARFAIGAYLNVPVYAAFHEWLGNGPLLQPMWDAWKAGDRKAASAAIPNEVIDRLVVSGSPGACKEHLDRYRENGVTCPVVALLPVGLDAQTAYRSLAPG